MRVDDANRLTNTVTKLYNLKRGQRFRVVADSKVPPAARPIESFEVLEFGHIDGMYSYCIDGAGNIVHPVCWSEVEVVQ